ncbi:hydantoinase/oxoprolinase family protein [Aquabacterium sp. J223]|nr:hydantoinase/oxoprolinase family protein [Aquabacterium sp. J223]
MLDEASGLVHTHKVPSTPHSPSQAAAAGIEQLVGRLGGDPADIGSFVHGTTIGLNAVLERRGAKVALVVAAGNRDLLELARLQKPNQFDLMSSVPASLVPRRRVVELPVRLDRDGEVVLALTDKAIDRCADALAAMDVEAVTVCLLNAFAQPQQEAAVVQELQERLQGVMVSRSTDLWPEAREYERGIVAVLNAYVQPLMSRYVEALKQDAQRVGLRSKLYLTRSNGGVMSAQTAARLPVHTLLSGPAAGVVGAAFVARAAGVLDCVTCDIGGTSADVSIIRGGVPVYSTDAGIGDFPMVMPAVDVFAVGAGGGSIARFDSLGLMKLGPQSAGAVPGPAAYGRGGEQPTTTDAYLVCGFLDPERFLGGAMRLHTELAERALAPLAERLGVDIPAAAEAVLALGTSNMSTSLLPMLTKRGIDPRDFVLVPYGGAGATHACLLAEDLGMTRILVPPSPGTLCALGAMIADLKADYIRSWRKAVDAVPDESLRASFEALEAQARGWLDGEQAEVESVSLDFSADMRYAGQAFELEVPLPDRVAQLGGDCLRACFEAAYATLYGAAQPGSPVEVVNLRARITGRRPTFALRELPAADAGSEPVPAGRRRIRYGGTLHDARVYRREALLAGHGFDGPAIVEQFDTTTVVAPGFRATVDRVGALMLTRTSP